MKTTIAYYLMLLYITLMLQPIIPIVSDVYAHVFFEINHLATIHAKYGSHHLEIALAKTVDNNNSKNKIASKSKSFDAVYLFTNDQKNSTNYKLSSTFTTIFMGKLLSIFLLLHTPPPKYFC